MSDKPKGRRLGAPATMSTLADPTPPEAPARGDLVPAPDRLPTALPVQPVSPPVVEAPPLQERVLHSARPAEEERPRAVDLIQHRTEITREQINGMTPKVLRLRRRMRQYWIDHDLELRDQMALALDAWLTERGY